MFNFANIFKAVVTIAAVANTVIRKVAEKNPVVANMVQRFDNFVSSFTGGGGSSGGSSSGKGGDSGSGGLSAAERQRREEERRQRELDRRASAFDDDIARKLSDQRPDIEADGDAAGNQTAPSLRDLTAMEGFNLDQWIHGEPMSAELQVAAMGNPVAQALLQMLRHERPQLQSILNQSPSTIAFVISTFGLAAEDDEATIQAAQLCEIALSGDNTLRLPTRLMSQEDTDLLKASDARFGVGSTFIPKTREPYSIRGDEAGSILVSYSGQDQTLEPTAFIDPCVDNANPRQCYVSQLASFGVGFIDDQDLENAEVLENIGSEGSAELGRRQHLLEEFNDAQLAVLLQGVHRQAEELSLIVNEIPDVVEQFGRRLTPEEAFTKVFGSIEFGYAPTLQTGETRPPENADPTNLNETIYILLDDSSFSERVVGEGGFIGGLPDSFVSDHEMGHVFANRLGMPEIDTSGYVDATGSIWNEGDEAVIRAFEPGSAVTNELQPFMRDGVHATDGQGRLLFTVPRKFYFALGFSGGSLRQMRSLLPNEFSQASPSEGFADTYSNFMSNPQELARISQRRYNYLKDNMPSWLLTILCRNGEIECEDS